MQELTPRNPSLRFSEFSDGWKPTKLGAIAVFSKGALISKEDTMPEGDTECIRYGELYTFYGETINLVLSRTNLDKKNLVLSKENDVIIPASGESNIDIARAACVLRKGIALGGDLNIIRSPLNGIFLSYYLNSHKRFDIARLAQGVSVVHLYPAHLKALDLHVPDSAEQQKIAAFLSAVDERLAQLQRKKRLLLKYKKGVMQQVFSQKIRFKDPNGNPFPNWEEKKIGQVFSERSGRGFSDSELLSVTISSGVVKAADLERRDSSSAEKSNYKFVKAGDVVYNSMRMWQGASGVSSLDGVVSPAYTVLKPRSETHSPFFGFLFKYSPIVFLFRRYSQGLTSDTWNLKFGQISVITLTVPGSHEQKMIADFLSSIDIRIETIGQQIEKTKTFKKGLLQQMFI